MTVKYIKNGWIQTLVDGTQETWIWKDGKLFLKERIQIMEKVAE